MASATDARLRSRSSDYRPRPWVRTLALVVLALGLLLLVPGSPVAETAVAAPPPTMTEGWTRVVTGGFGEPGNSHISFTSEFKGHLYVSTMASGASELISGSDKRGSDIWRTSDGVTWEQLGTPGLGEPRNIMFDLVVFKDRLYALSINSGGDGFEIWVTSDGKEFAQLEEAGFGDPNSRNAVPMVLAGRLILAVANPETGVQIWVSDDGDSFRQVVSGGLGVAGTVTAFRPRYPEDPQPILDGMLYVGVSNPTSGGEIWRTADGLEWERVADRGLGVAERHSLAPWLVFGDMLYAFGLHGGDPTPGFDLFRSRDGLDWEQVVEDGLGLGVHRNVAGDLAEFKGRLYLSTYNQDPRLLVPGNTMERFALSGFRLYVSDDGTTWSQVGADGFGSDATYSADIGVHGDIAYLEGIDYREGSRLWKSADGQRWELIFHEPPRSFYHYAAGRRVFQGHYFWMSNDLEKGVDIWRSDDAIVAEPPATVTSTDTTPGTTSSTLAGTLSSGPGTVAPGGQTEGSDTSAVADKDEAAGAQQGLSGGILALIIALAVVAVAGISAAAYFFGRSRGGGAGGNAAPPASTPPVSPGFCLHCGSALTPDAGFCPGCGRKL